MSASLTMTTPRGWRLIESGPGQEDQITEAVNEAFATAPRDSAAIDKHWMRERLRDSFAPVEDAEVVAIAYPTKPMAGQPLPVSATVLRLSTRTAGVDDAMASLARLSTADSSSKLMTAPAGLILRNHAVRDTTDAFAHTVSEAPVSAGDREQILASTTTVRTLRARYVVPSTDGTPWHCLAFSAVLGTDEQALVDVYLELCDAFAGSLTMEAV